LHRQQTAAPVRTATSSLFRRIRWRFPYRKRCFSFDLALIASIAVDHPDRGGNRGFRGTEARASVKKRVNHAVRVEVSSAPETFLLPALYRPDAPQVAADETAEARARPIWCSPDA
jgi:hypothetical protein